MVDARDEQDPYIEHRRLLFATAYRMLGSVTDAEDVLQDTWLSWNTATATRSATPRPTWCARSPTSH